MCCGASPGPPAPERAVPSVPGSRMAERRFAGLWATAGPPHGPGDPQGGSAPCTLQKGLLLRGGSGGVGGRAGGRPRGLLCVGGRGRGRWSAAASQAGALAGSVRAAREPWGSSRPYKFLVTRWVL